MKKFKYDRVKFVLLFQNSIKNLSLGEQKRFFEIMLIKFTQKVLTNFFF